MKLTDIVKGKEIEYTYDNIESCELGIDLQSFKRNHYNVRGVYETISRNYKGKMGNYGVQITIKGVNYFYTVGFDGYVRVKSTSDTILKGQLQGDEIVYTCKERNYFTDEEKEDIWGKVLADGVELPNDIKEDINYVLDVVDKNDEILEEINKVLKKYNVWELETVEDWENTLNDHLRKKREYVRDKESSLVRGAGVTLIKPKDDYKEYRESLVKILDKVKDSSKRVVGYKHLFSNTTTSCYIDFTILGLEEDFKVTVRNHDKIKEQGYYKVYVEDNNLEGLEERLSELIKTHIEIKERRMMV